jgi:hypothetical protein
VKAQILARDPVRPERLSHDIFQRPAPPSLLIDEVEALWAPIAEADDWSAYEQKAGRHSRPCASRAGADLFCRQFL